MVDMRISVLPTINGEKVVFRILDKNAAIRDIDDVGLSSADLERASRLIEMPQGMVLTTGPTGRGTLSFLSPLRRVDYAAMQRLRAFDRIGQLALLRPLPHACGRAAGCGVRSCRLRGG